MEAPNCNASRGNVAPKVVLKVHEQGEVVVRSGRAGVFGTHRDLVCRSRLGSYFKEEPFWKFTQSCLPLLLFITNVVIQATTSQLKEDGKKVFRSILQCVVHVSSPYGAYLKAAIINLPYTRCT